MIQSISSTHLNAHLSESQRSIYLGVDPTAASLHIGHLVPILALVHLVRAGHRGILLVGGATASVGDPSGKTSSRPDLPKEQLQANVEAITAQLNYLLSRIASHIGLQREELGIQVLNNADFYSGLTLLDFLREVGRFSRMGDMLARDSVKTRLPEPLGSAPPSSTGLSFTEFAYQLLQAYDFYLLNSKASVGNCTIQLGGSDQMGNIMAGVELIRRKKFGSAAEQDGGAESSEHQDAGSPSGAVERRRPPAFAVTLPLLTTASGEKLGKSAGNAVFLDPTFSSDYDFFQYFLRATDTDVPKLLNSLTFLNVSTGTREADEGVFVNAEDKKSVGDARLLLAEEVTSMARGSGALQRAKAATAMIHRTLPALKGQKELQNAIKDGEQLEKAKGQNALDGSSVTWSMLSQMARDEGDRSGLSQRRFQLRPHDEHNGIVGCDFLTLFSRVGLTGSRSETRRLLAASSGSLFLFNKPLASMDPRDVAKLRIEEKHVAWFYNGKAVDLGDGIKKRRGMLWLRKGKRESRVLLLEMPEASATAEGLDIS